MSGFEQKKMVDAGYRSENTNWASLLIDISGYEKSSVGDSEGTYNICL